MFRFRLQRLLDYRRQELDAARLVLAQCQRIADDWRTRLEVLREERRVGSQRYLQTNQVLTPAELQLRVGVTRNLEAHEEALGLKLAHADHEVELARENVVEAHREVRGLEKLRERRKEQHGQEMRTQEAKEMDDIRVRHGEMRPASPTRSRR